MSTHHCNRSGLRLNVILATFALPVLSFSVAPTQAHPLYETTHVVRQQRNACEGAKSCKLIASEPRRVKAVRDAEITARCPDARPRFAETANGIPEATT